MASSTRLRVSTSGTIFHRTLTGGETDDIPSHDTGTRDANASGIGGAGDVEISTGSTNTYVDGTKVPVDTSVAIGASSEITKFIMIRHSGFQDALKTTVSTDKLSVGLGGTAANASYAGFELAPGEAIVLHGITDLIDNLTKIEVLGPAAGILVEYKKL